MDTQWTQHTQWTQLLCYCAIVLFEDEGSAMLRLKLITHECSIETWALEEAKRRLQAEGTLPEDDA